MKEESNEHGIMKNMRKENVSTGLVLFALVYMFLLYLNLIFPTQSDDIGRKLEGVQRAIQSYMHWNGRFGELMLVTFGSYFATTPWYALVNAAIGAGVFMMLFVLITGRFPQKSYRDISIFSIIVVFYMIDPIFAFGSVFYWAAGSFNYLWAWFFILLLVLPMRLFWHGKPFSKRLNITLCATGIPLGVIAGWSSEFNIVLILLWMLSIVFAKLRKKKLPIWYYSSLCAFLLGWGILYACPGMRERAVLVENYYSMGSLLKLGPVGFAKKVLSTFDVFKRFYYENFCLISLFLLLTALFYKPSRKKFESAVLAVFLLLFCLRSMPKLFFVLCALFICIMSAVVIRKDNAFISNLFIALGVIVLAEFFFIGVTIQVGIPRRARFQYTLLNTGIIALNMMFCFEAFKEKPRIVKTAAAVCVCVLLVCASFVGAECTRMQKKWQRMEQSIEQQKAQGITDVIVDKSTFISRYKGYGDWGNPGENPDVSPNTTYARYYGVKTLVAE